MGADNVEASQENVQNSQLHQFMILLRVFKWTCDPRFEEQILFTSTEVQEKKITKLQTRVLNQ